MTTSLENFLRLNVPRVIIINDSDGHGHALEYSDDNMRWLLQAVINANDVNTTMDDPDQGRALLAQYATAGEIEKFMFEGNGPVDRSGGGQIYFVELQGAWHSKLNPFI